MRSAISEHGGNASRAGWRRLHGHEKESRKQIKADLEPPFRSRTPQGPGRKIIECIALAKAYEVKLGYAPVPDPDFAKDVQAAIDAHREPLNPPSWD